MVCGGFQELRDTWLPRAVELGAINPQLNYTRENSGLRVLISLTQAEVVTWSSTPHNQTLASGYVSHFPGCCGIGILHDASTPRGDRAKWLEFIFRLRLDFCKQQPWGLVTYTDVVGAELQDTLVKKLGFQTAKRSFFNPNSGNRVKVYTKVISGDGQYDED